MKHILLPMIYSLIWIWDNSLHLTGIVVRYEFFSLTHCYWNNLGHLVKCWMMEDNVSDRSRKKILWQVDLLFCTTENTKHFFVCTRIIRKAKQQSKATDLKLKPVWQSTLIYEYVSIIYMCLIICLLPVVGTYQ